jgi:hypothetical protein
MKWKKDEMRDFLPYQSEPWEFLTSRYGPVISKEEIKSLGLVCSSELKIDLFRESKRRKETMLKWFSDHWQKIRPFLENNVTIVFSDEDQPD